MLLLSQQFVLFSLLSDPLAQRLIGLVMLWDLAIPVLGLVGKEFRKSDILLAENDGRGENREYQTTHCLPCSRTQPHFKTKPNNQSNNHVPIPDDCERATQIPTRRVLAGAPPIVAWSALVVWPYIVGAGP